mmetsp:Transcript_75788/g.150217  ORF Transcript_75788/g.150217 Transcript_75788/m.150217 type:complete len:88 (+) Transcript_75788:175-438(+)
MVRIYWSVRAFHRINVPEQEDYYRRLQLENDRYWEPVVSCGMAHGQIGQIDQSMPSCLVSDDTGADLAAKSTSRDTMTVQVVWTWMT